MYFYSFAVKIRMGLETFNVNHCPCAVSNLVLTVSSTKIIGLPYPDREVYVTSGHVNSRNQGLYPILDDKGGKGGRAWERGCSHHCMEKD